VLCQLRWQPWRILPARQLGETLCSGLTEARLPDNKAIPAARVSFSLPPYLMLPQLSINTSRYSLLVADLGEVRGSRGEAVGSMRITAREYAQWRGVTVRAVRMQLQKGKLPGVKELDPDTGAEVWWVELPDPQEAVGSRSEAPMTLPGSAAEDGGRSWEGHLIEQLHQENLELAGRVGFLQAKLQEAETKLALREAPQPAPQQAYQRAWWQFWRSG
jgi:hypothetical protein